MKLFKLILNYFGFVIVHQKFHSQNIEYISHLEKINNDLTNQIILLSEGKKIFDKYQKQLIEMNRLRARISSMEKYRESRKVKYESTKKRLDEVIGNKAREKYCHNK